MDFEIYMHIIMLASPSFRRCSHSVLHTFPPQDNLPESISRRVLL